MDTEDDLVQCPQCDSLQGQLDAVLGVLGGLEHYRCRNCGVIWSQIAEGDEPWEDDDEHE